MSDIELPDSRHSDLGIDLEKGIFLRRQQRPAQDTRTQDTDSGNNSLNTNRSNCSTGTSSSSKTSQPVESSFMEEDEDDYAENIKMSPEIRITKPQINKNIIEVRYRGKRNFRSIEYSEAETCVWRWINSEIVLCNVVMP